MIKYIKEVLLSKALRRKIQKLPAITLMDGSESEIYWVSIRNELRSMILNERIKTFYDWDVLKKYFIVGDDEYIKTEYDALVTSPNYNRYDDALRDKGFIRLHSSGYCSDTNSNRIHHAYHMQQFEDSTALKITDFDFIFEFGGGYGNLCHYIRSLGYKGTYIIFDCPELIYLQEYYLKNSDLDYTVIEDRNSKIGEGQTYGIYDQKIFDELNINCRKGLCIGTWSISETSIPFRNMFFNNNFIRKTHNYLIGFQENFGHVDNLVYFTEWLKRNNYHHILKKIQHIPMQKNHYLFVFNE